MRYISDDGKIFNTEQECCEHEQKIGAEKVKREKLEKERQNRLDTINKKYEELQTLLSEYEKDYGVRQNHMLHRFMKFWTCCVDKKERRV